MSSRHNHEEIHDTIQCTVDRYHPFPESLFNKDTYFFIKRIEFFSNATDAELAQNGTVIDLSSQVAAERTLSIDAENTDIKFKQYHAEGLLGKSEFDDKEHALSLMYSNSTGERADYGSRIKFSLRMKNPYVLKENQSYMVVTYKTNITAESGKIRLLLGNFWGEHIILDHDVSVSGGEYVRTKPINIHTKHIPKQDFFDRLRHPYTPDSIYTNAVLIYISSHNSSGLQAYPYFELLYNTEGTADVVIYATEYKIKRGDIVIVPPLRPHNVTAQNAPVTLHSIKFQPEYLYAYGVPFPIMRSYLYAWQENIQNAPLFSAEEAQASGLDKLVEELIRLIKDSSFRNHIKIHAKLLTIFSIALDRFATENSDDCNSIVATSSFTHAIEEAQKNMYSFTTADAAKVSNLSYNYFCSGFKKAYGMSFSAYLDSLRLSESTRLLLTTDMSITEIAATLSFSDTCHYIRKFKLAYNITPHKYRDRVKKRN